MASRSSPTYKLSFPLAAEFASARVPKFSPCVFRSGEREPEILDFRYHATKLSDAALRKYGQQKIALATASSGIAATMFNVDKCPFSILANFRHS
ncbi:hypothetical protein TNCV_4022931 [Trichonephila clavipes]|nr:hypothetical protein TNCV_4022931 [Trichonephila clavipes]